MGALGLPSLGSGGNGERFFVVFPALFFAHHLMTGTQYFGSEHPLREQEVAFRFMAREPRTRRRMLAISLHEVVDKSRTAKSFSARVMTSEDERFPYYVFLFMHRKPDLTDDEYRNMRIHLLSDYCSVAKLEHPKAKDIIGIASEAGLRAKGKQDALGILKEVSSHAARRYEYPVDQEGKPRRVP
jgi:hypothetical protein